jgi:zinc transporter ZupT
MNPARKFIGTHFLGLESIGSIAITFALSVWINNFNGHTVIDPVLNSRRVEVYSVMIGVFGSLLGFVIATVSILLAFDSHPRMKALRESRFYPLLWKIFKSSMIYLAIGVLVLLVGLLFDRDEAPHWRIFYICLFAIIISAWRTGRCIWVLHHVINIMTARRDEEML